MTSGRIAKLGRSLAPGVVVLAGAAAVAACASNNKVEISDEEYDDVAISIATTVRTDASGGELGALADGITLARGGTIVGFAVAADDPGAVTGTRGDETYRYAIVCRGVDGAILAVCDGLTDSADISVTWSGPLAVPYNAAVPSRTGRFLATGLAGAAVTASGSAKLAYTTAYRSQTRGVIASYEIAQTATYSRLELAASANWPTAGVVTYALEVRSKRERENVTAVRHIELPGTLSFGSSGHATLELDYDSVAAADTSSRRIYDLELATGALVRTGGSELAGGAN